jgi:hypothetical protein
MTLIKIICYDIIYINLSVAWDPCVNFRPWARSALRGITPLSSPSQWSWPGRWWRTRAWTSSPTPCSGIKEYRTTPYSVHAQADKEVKLLYSTTRHEGLPTTLWTGIWWRSRACTSSPTPCSGIKEYRTTPYSMHAQADQEVKLLHTTRHKRVTNNSLDRQIMKK